MGMFDEIRCDAPLPDGYDAEGAWFQSKSFPDRCMCRYTITSARRLIDSAGNDLEPEGYLTFYTSDPSDGQADVSHSEWTWYEYRARFAAGELQEIVRVEDPDAQTRYYYGLASFRWFASSSFMFGDPEQEGDDNEESG